MSTPSRRRAYGVSERILFVANQVEAFNRNREEHREVDVTFRYVDVETFQNQGKAHQNQERERQHFYRTGTDDRQLRAAKKTIRNAGAYRRRGRNAKLFHAHTFL